MRYLSQFLRYLLNINTIWGLMILVSFAAALVQHYLPTRNVVPAEVFGPGETTLTIQLTNPKPAKDEPPDTLHEFVVTRAGDDLRAVEPTSAPAVSDAPRLLRIERVASGGPDLVAYAVIWDARTYGTYRLLVGDRVVGSGRLVTLRSLTDAAFDYAKTAFDIALGLVAAMVLFLGLMRIGQDSGLVQLAARALHPVIRVLFPDVPREHPASAAIVMNMTTSMLGLGNAATPFGLKAMQELQKLNPSKTVASNAMVMLLGYNTAGFALLPVTLLALRKSAGAADPFEIIGTCMLAGAVSTLTALVLARLLSKLPAFSYAAAAEGEPQASAGGTN